MRKSIGVAAVALAVALAAARIPTEVEGAPLAPMALLQAKCPAAPEMVIPAFNDPWYQARPNAFARYLRTVARHQNGFSTTDGSRYPGTPSATGNVAIHPHKRICTVKADNGVDVNNEGQMIGYLQFFGSRMSPEYKLEPGEIGYLLVQRDGLGGPGARYSTLWLHGADGERLAAWPYSVCHPTKSHGSSPNAVFGWLTTETRKDCVATDTARFATWFREHHDYYHHDHDPDPLRDLKGLKKHELHNEQPWFACQEGCCHIVE